MNHDALLARAASAQAAAYAPYSGFRVGAALLCADGTVFTGANVENASLGLTICAERNAVFAAVAAGHRDFSAVAVVADADEPVAPCGACRQVLAEFTPEMTVVSRGSGGRAVWSLTELLPAGFRRIPGVGSRDSDVDSGNGQGSGTT
ncbi:MAG: cytidine deaminase [Gemmatimonadota bacterium]